MGTGTTFRRWPPGLYSATRAPCSNDPKVASASPNSSRLVGRAKLSLNVPSVVPDSDGSWTKVICPGPCAL